MIHPTSPRRPWTAALAATGAAAVALGLVGALALGLSLRAEAGRAGDALAATADATAARVDPGDTRAARRELERAGVSARLLGPAGRVRLETGAGGAWGRGAPGWAARLATVGTSGWSLREGAVEARRGLPSGASVVLRAPLPAAAGRPDGVAPVGALAAVLALLAGAWAWWRAARAGRRLRALSAAAEATAGGRPSVPEHAGRGEWRRLTEALGAVARRCADLQVAAEARVETLGAALEPLPQPVAARTPVGGRVRNAALERAVAGMGVADAAAVEEAVAAGLSAEGPVARRLALTDGRALDVEAWSVPGGRLVALADRSEQERLAALRRQVTGAAARHLQAPINEIEAIGSELLGQVPAHAAPSVRRMLAAGDRMGRLVGQLLRGTEHDPRARPLRMRELGVAGIAYALGRALDRRLRDRGLRLEPRVPADLPPVRTDPALAHEILTELIANAAAHTPRGGTIALEGRALPGGRVEIAVLDTGPGIPAPEIDLVTERFGRGAGAAGLRGAGLGLGVAAALAERLGGRLTVQAGPGGAARLELPAARPRAPEGEPARPEAVSAAPAPSP